MKNRTLSGLKPKQKRIVDIIASVLLLFFAHSALTTYFQLESLKNMLAFYTENQNEIAWIIVITELITSVLLFLPRTRYYGLIVSSLFALTALIVIFSFPHFPHDFGGIVNAISHKQKYFFYILIALLGITGIFLSFKKPQNEQDGTSVVYT